MGDAGGGKINVGGGTKLLPLDVRAMGKNFAPARRRRMNSLTQRFAHTLDFALTHWRKT
jgi:hypothetical protein